MFYSVIRLLDRSVQVNVKVYGVKCGIIFYLLFVWFRVRVHSTSAPHHTLRRVQTRRAAGAKTVRSLLTSNDVTLNVKIRSYSLVNALSRQTFEKTELLFFLFSFGAFVLSSSKSF